MGVMGLTQEERKECELIGRLCELARMGETPRMFELLAQYEDGQAERLASFDLHDTANYVRDRAESIREQGRYLEQERELARNPELETD